MFSLVRTQILIYGFAQRVSITMIPFHLYTYQMLACCISKHVCCSIFSLLASYKIHPHRGFLIHHLLSAVANKQ